jgi:hypothetical protein
MRCLVWNEGGRPTVAQQRRLLEVTQGTHVPVAIVSSSVAVRFIVSVFALANRHVRFFPAAQIARALSYLCNEQSERAAARTALERLCARAQMPGLARGH